MICFNSLGTYYCMYRPLLRITCAKTRMDAIIKMLNLIEYNAIKKI